MSDIPKLVRDKVPDSIRARGAHPIVRTVSKRELLPWLFDKLREEAAELQASNSLEELADVLEVIEAIRITMDIDPVETHEYRVSKRKRLGGFRQGIILEAVVEATVDA